MPRIRTGTVSDSIPGGRHAPKKELSWLSVLSLPEGDLWPVVSPSPEGPGLLLT